MGVFLERRVTIYGHILHNCPSLKGRPDPHMHVNILIKSKHAIKLVNNLESQAFFTVPDADLPQIK